MSGTPRERRDEMGFTLIELMTVVLIISILIAIAIPTFIGARNRASDRAAQATLRNALGAAKTVATDADQYPANGAPLVAALTAVEPNLHYSAGGVNVATFSTHEVSVSTPAYDEFIAAAWSKDSNECFFIRDVSVVGGGTFYAVSNPATPDCELGSPPTTWTAHF